MKLVKARIKNYKCIDDSEEFSLGRLTCLAGKNESGKTAILQAFYHLNPVEASRAPLNAVMEYPRQRLDEYEGGAKDFLTTVWELNAPDIDALEAEFGTGCLTNNTITIHKLYPDQTMWNVSLNESTVLTHLAQQVDLTDAAQKRLAKHRSTIEAYNALLEDAPTKGEVALKDRLAQYRDHSATLTAIDILSSRRPKFLYFSTYEQLPGQMSLNLLTTRLGDDSKLTTPDRVFLALLDLAGTSVQDIQKAELSEQLIARLEAVSNTLSREIFQYWTQNRHLKVQFRYDVGQPGDPAPFNEGYVFRIRVENQRHGVTVAFDERSAGFVWFFSFLVWFSQMRKTYGENLVILLDEPGLSLHGKAQQDLLRYIHERLLPQYQVIYTTHSPFMIDASDILSVRTVEDVVTKDDQVLGTKVGDQVLSTDADTLFPLRAALGYEVTQSLFVGENTLLVEGPSDLIYLRWASRELEQRKRAGLSKRWTITPAGGIDKIGSFVALFGATNLNIAVLTDYRPGDRAKVRSLQESDLLKSGQVFSAEMFVPQELADVEDILGREFYVALVNECYGLNARQALPVTKPTDAPQLVLDEVEARFRTLPPAVAEFDHYAPAAYLIEHSGDFSATNGIDDTLGRFEDFFKQINALLP